jgi:hypothetical protein
MAKLSSAFIVFVSSISCIYFLSGCNNNTVAPSAKLSFKDEKSMREALKGTWILKAYMDSIDAGLTPKLLEYMLGKCNRIKFVSESNILLINKRAKFMDEGQYHNLDGWTDSLIVKFSPNDNKIIFIETIDPKQKPVADTAEYIFSHNDTILRLYKDSTTVDFVKYSIGKCDDIGDYSHLINSKYIAGKYYSLDDTAHLHHIIFTKCGNMEGAKYIMPKLSGYSTYFVSIEGFLTGSDRIVLYNDNGPDSNIIPILYNWSVIDDSLILRSNQADCSDQPIVLVKAR